MQMEYIIIGIALAIVANALFEFLGYGQAVPQFIINTDT